MGGVLQNEEGFRTVGEGAVQNEEGLCVVPDGRGSAECGRSFIEQGGGAEEENTVRPWQSSTAQRADVF